MNDGSLTVLRSIQNGAKTVSEMCSSTKFHTDVVLRHINNLRAQNKIHLVGRRPAAYEAMAAPFHLGEHWQFQPHAKTYFPDAAE